MSFDDKLREAFDRSAPASPNAPRVRGALGDAMQRARRRHRIRRGVAVTTLSLAVAGGGVGAALQLTGPDNEIDTRTSSLPPPEATDAPSETTTPARTTPTASDPGGAGDTTPTSRPVDPPTSSGRWETTTSAAPPPTTTAVVPDTLSGPHSTPCGSVTFVVNATVDVESHTAEPGYVFSTEGEGSTEVHAKWSEGPGEECQIEAHLEDGLLDVHFDEE